MKKKPAAAGRRAAAPSARGAEGQWSLCLYVAGQTPRSLAAMANLKRICEQYLQGRYRIEVVDLLHQPQLSRDDGIVAIPTLVRRSPAPVRKLVGDLSDTVRTLRELGLVAPRAEDTPARRP